MASVSLRQSPESKTRSCPKCHEPLRFAVRSPVLSRSDKLTATGDRNRLRYEVVVNWVQKDRVGGYLSTPKDKALSAEKAAAAK